LVTAVIAIDVTPWTTDAVYDIVPDTNVGEIAPVLKVRLLKREPEFTETDLVTTIVYVEVDKA
jgi:hypothetical protein